jgi:hypothetical protein
MAQTTTPNMTVLHLETGHVLAAAASGIREFTVEQLTGGTYLSVRLPIDPVGAAPALVNVTPDLLTAKSYALDDDVLSRPWEYRVDESLPVLTFGGTPLDLDAAAPGGPAGTKVTFAATDGTAALTLWQVGDDVEIGRSVLKNGIPDAPDPAGWEFELVACAREPLGYKKNP